jgi:hypothetical protein
MVFSSELHRKAMRCRRPRLRSLVLFDTRTYYLQRLCYSAITHGFLYRRVIDKQVPVARLFHQQGLLQCRIERSRHYCHKILYEAISKRSFRYRRKTGTLNVVSYYKSRC